MPQPGEPPDRSATRPYGRDERSDPYGPERRSDGRNRGEAYHTDPHGHDAYGHETSPREAYGREPGGAAQSRRQTEADQLAHRPALPGPRLATPIGQPPRRQQSRPAHMTPRHDRRRLGALVVFALVVGLTAFGVQRFVFAEDPAAAARSKQHRAARRPDPETRRRPFPRPSRPTHPPRSRLP